jgi:hypothetical protein
MRNEQAQAGGKVLGEAGQTKAALETISTGEIDPGISTVPPKAPVFGSAPDGTPVVTNYDKYGIPKASLGSKGVNINMPGKEADMALDVLKGGLTKWQEKADIAKDTLSANIVALNAINEGARIGGGEGIKQAVRKGLQAFGINAPDTAQTEELQMALGNAVLQYARKLAPVTKEDVERLQSWLGSISTDPTALEKMLTLSNAVAMRTLHDYNQYVGEQKGNLKSDYARSLFSGADIGYGLPPQVPGDTRQALMTIQAMRQRGMPADLPQFQIGGETLPNNATFRLGNPPQMPLAQPLEENLPPGVKRVPR